MMTVLIVEDENLAVKRLQKLLTDMDASIQVQAVTKSIAETVEWLHTHPQPDIILLDIELADGQSFEIFNQVAVTSVVIFTTSYNEYALKAFRVNSIDYLLKPIEKEDLQKAFTKYEYLRSLTKAPETETINVERLLKDLHGQMNTKSYRRRFLVKNANKFVSVDISDIGLFYVEGRVVFLKAFNAKKYIVDYTLDELEQLLDPAAFFRINRSCIVAQKSVLQMEEHFGNRLFVHVQPVIDKDTVVSREKVTAFKTWMGH